MKRGATLGLVLLACAMVIGCYPNLTRQDQAPGTGQSANVSSGLFFPFVKGRSKKCDTSPCDTKIDDFTSCYPFFGCYGTVEDEAIHLKNGAHNIDIVWSLPTGFWFCDNLGDGVFLKVQADYDLNEFDQMKVTGSTGGPGNKCWSQYHWRAKNTKSLPDHPFPYRVLFHYVDDNRIYIADPWIFND